MKINSNYKLIIKHFLSEIRYFLLTGFYLGKLPKMPGTYTSIGTTLLLFILLKFTNYITILTISYILFVFSVKEIDKYEKKHNIHDAPETSIDEVIGMFFAVILSYPMLNITNDLILSIQLLILLILFRIFDILKPGIIGFVDKNVNNSFGVVADDIIAGFYSAVFLTYATLFFK